MRALAPVLFLAMIAGCGDGGSTGSSGAAGAGASSATAGGAGAAGSGGASATGGSGGNGGAGGSAMTGSGGSTTSSSMSTSSGAVACKWGDDCGLGYYCFAPGCMAGTCAIKPVPSAGSPDKVPVCGCDGATYFNADAAAASGMSVASDMPCATMIACDKGTLCPGVMKCNREVSGSAACSPDAPGTCWANQVSCPLDGPKARACLTNTCELTCSLIQGQNPWFEDPSCN